MNPEGLLAGLITAKDPLEPVLSWLVRRLEPAVDLKDISVSFNHMEEDLRDFEEWLDEAWGLGFYKILVEDGYAIPKAFQRAGELDGNILLLDGFSIRELSILRKAFPGRVEYTAGRAPTPTTTETAAKRIFQSTNLKEALTGSKLYWGRRWKGSFISDPSDPPRTAGRTGLMFFTVYPDAPLHGARKYGAAVVQDISNVMRQIIKLVEELSRNAPLVLTGDHGYIYLGDNPGKYMWIPYRRKQRFGEEYGGASIEVDGVKVAVGRRHTPVSRRSDAVITHGGISLTESLVPVVTLDAEKR